ncbi:alpha/beta hydrolase [Acinetobacter bouvetii]|uniref:Acetyl-hydrolase LipR n=1 Tax=Acinetobacter bouvetii TaxID=202951 RepID=A0A811G7V6_9GAMM|nr:alpha/beta hydrolase [Acinetobacter bouvetii]CAB1207285.1 Putative acetyl-hydrolase LipR [Acinetobacter bouvetii]
MKIDPVWKQLVTESFLKTAIRTPSQFNLPPSSIRFALEQMCRLFPQNKEVSLRPLRLAGLRAEEIKPNNEATQLILYIHGGAFFLGSLNTHRAFLSDIVARTQMQLIHIDYPLAPEQPFPEALDALFDVYNILLDQGIQAKDIILAGDSCGANLAVALALKIRDQELPQASGLMLLSPFLDLTLTSESLRYNRKHDALLSIETLETGIDYYVPKSMDKADPAISPLFADLTGLPPTLIQVGSKEILLDDAQRFKAKAEQSNVKVSFKLYTGMWHDFQLFTAWFDEAKRALADLAEFAHELDQD